MNKRRRYNRTRKAPGARTRPLPRKKGQKDKKRAAKVIQSEPVWKVKRAPLIMEEDRENMDVDDLTQPTVHVVRVGPDCHFKRMYERDDWRDALKEGELE